MAVNPKRPEEGLVPVSDVEIFLGLHDLSDPILTGNFKYERCHLFLLAAPVLIFVIRRFLVSKMIEPGGDIASDIAIIKVNGEIDIRYFTVMVA